MRNSSNDQAMTLMSSCSDARPPPDRGVPPRTVDDQIFTSVEEALHGVFLKRVRDLMDRDSG